MVPNDFAVIILTHGRPAVPTVASLHASGYTGRIVLLVDDEDATVTEYKVRHGAMVEVFSKAEVAQRREADMMDNDGGKRTAMLARHACFDVARRLGLRCFMMMDDDYTRYTYQIKGHEEDRARIRNLDGIFAAMRAFVEQTPITTVAMAQGGDFIGGLSPYHNWWKVKRKAMNSFLCHVDRPIHWRGRLNDDVNAYVGQSPIGAIFLTLPAVAIQQPQMQQSAGGMSEAYSALGTFRKAFYSVMTQPSSVKVRMLSPAVSVPRLHHAVAWRYTAPKILAETCRKASVA